MAEIKSTLELVMEKMGRMKISEKEKEGNMRKEISQKVTALHLQLFS